MSRLSSLSAAAVSALLSQESNDTFITLITISGTGISPAIRLADNYTQRINALETPQEITYGVVSNYEDGSNKNYLFLPFNLTLPIEDANQAPTCNLTINDVTRYLIPTIRDISSPPTANIAFVLKSSPNTVEISFPSFLISGINYNADSVTAILTLGSLAQEPFPAHTFTPAYFPGLF
jgi:hypothetical protein